MDMMMHMSQQTELFRVQLDARLLSFAQAVESPVNQALHASSTAPGMATELAGIYVGLEANVERSFNDAAATRHASEEVAAATLRQTQDAFQQASINLEAATISMTQARHENASSQAQTEALTAQLAQTRLPERGPPLPFADARILERMQQRVNLETEQRINLEAQQRINLEAELPMTSSPSELVSRYIALFNPLNPRVNFDLRASPIGTRQPSPERPRVFNPFPNSEPIQTPLSLP
jgi:hypothetical protein